MALERYDWLLAAISIFFCASSFGNGANDVANSYATSVAARTLTMPQAGFLAMITEFVGAVGLGSRVTGTIKNKIISIDRFKGNPGALMLAMTCAEVGSATWLLIATRLGLPVSTTQTIVGALIGVGIASSASISWAWDKGSVSQVAASWGIAPAIAAAFGAIIFSSIKYGVMAHDDSFKWGLRLIPFYLSFTAAILALFMVIEVPNAPTLEDFGAGKAAGIVLGVFFGVLLFAYVFFVPYFHRRLVKNDPRIKFWHIPLGPLLWKDNPPIYLPARGDRSVVTDYYENAHATPIISTATGHTDSLSDASERPEKSIGDSTTLEKGQPDTSVTTATDRGRTDASVITAIFRRKAPMEPRDRFLGPTSNLPIAHPSRLWSWTKYILLQGVTRDCVSHADPRLRKTHDRAVRYDNRTEHLFTYCQVASAMLMSIAHGSNDVANAVGPWAAAYATYQASAVSTKAATPTWILVIAGFLLGTGFWFYGFHIIRSLGNRITQNSPSRGFSMELGAAITVLLASRLALPVSTTQCLTGATVGVALMNYDLKAINWRHLGKIFLGWVATLPAGGLIAGMLMLIALNTPHF